MAISRKPVFQNIIVAGTTKAATTSLFAYLADHPEICGSNVKETRFFLEKMYPVKSKYRYEDGQEKYENYFNDCGAKIRLEATPDYLYSSYAADAIHKTFGRKCLLIFVLRDPVDRFVSWFHFARQNNLIDNIGIDEFIAMQQISGDDVNQQHLLVLQQGCYTKYLKAYKSLFLPNQMLIVDYSTLCHNPKYCLQQITERVGLDSDFYNQYSFEVHNKTNVMRSTLVHQYYLDVCDRLRDKVNHFPKVRAAFKGLKGIIDPMYLKLNVSNKGDADLPQKAIACLEQYYERERLELKKIFLNNTL